MRRCGIVPHAQLQWCAAGNGLARLWANAAEIGYILISGLESHLVMIASRILCVSPRIRGILHSSYWYNNCVFADASAPLRLRRLQKGHHRCKSRRVSCKTRCSRLCGALDHHAYITVLT